MFPKIGAGSGIGRATCKLLAKEGASVIAADLNANSAKDTISSFPQESNRQHLAIPIDVKQSSSVHKALADVLHAFNKPPSIIVNCAGITRDNFLLKLSEDDFQEVIDVNLKGTFLVMQAFAKAIVDNKVTNASIVNLASVVGKYGNIGQTNYCASKAAVEAVSKTAAKEFAQFGIRCNAILPGFIKSPMTDAVPDKVKEKVKHFLLAGRFGNPEEVAEVIVFLASDKSSYINGTSIEVTGGFN